MNFARQPASSCYELAAMIERRDPGMVLLFAVVTCGFYLIYWYYKMYEEMQFAGGRTPTGNSFGIDFLLVIVTCGLYGIWVDYKISDQFNEMYRNANLPAHDTTTIVLGCDLAAFITGMFTNFVASAIHQDQLNKFVTYRSQMQVQPPAPPMASPPSW